MRQNAAMAVDLRSVLTSSSTAVVTMEMQGATLGAQAVLPMLRDVADEHGVLDAAVRLCQGARRAGVKVVHCVAEERADRAGSKINSRLQAVSAKAAGPGRTALEVGTAGSQVVPELGPEPTDLVVGRLHGLTPFMSTSLDQVLRNMGVTTIIAAGVSLNVGVLGLALNAVDLGYTVVLPIDAVAGVPWEYGQTLLDNTFAMIATLTTVDEVLAAWAP